MISGAPLARGHGRRSSSRSHEGASPGLSDGCVLGKPSVELVPQPIRKRLRFGVAHIVVQQRKIELASLVDGEAHRRAR